MSYFFVALTVLFTVYGQLVLKWQVSKFSPLPGEGLAVLKLLPVMLTNPWVISGFLAAFLASLSWMAAITKLEVSRAYPFMSLNFVFVLLLSAALFGEAITPAKAAGVGLVMLGLIVGTSG